MNQPETGDPDPSSLKLVKEAKPLTWKFWQKRRYIIVFLAFLGYIANYLLRVNLSVAIVKMTEIREIVHENGTVIGYEQDFNWSTQERGLILSSFFWGYTATSFAGGVFAKRFGGNVIFGLGIGLTAILTLLTPLLGRTVTSMIIIRVLQGLFEGVTYPCIHDIWFYWAPIPERSRMSSIAYAGIFFGTAITMPSSAYLAESLGWESVFYVFGSLGILWHIVWIVVVRSSPDKDRFISNDELVYIQSTVTTSKNKRIIPWKALLTSKAVYAIVASQFAMNWCFNTMLTQMPTFLADTLQYDLASSGFLSGAPYLTMGIFISSAGYLADMFVNRGYISIRRIRKLYVSGALLVQTICMLLAGFLLDPVWSVVLIIIGVGSGGFASSGYSVNCLDIAPEYASVILGYSNTLASLTGIVSPALTGVLVTQQTVEEWRIVFYITAGIDILGSIAYLFWSSGDVQPWA
ncbi:hypothetical protein HA402_000222 [Bradysia odoriphaga]|nr:hypothetical protein HA402_000222 [Bradysia odoriphaga]